MPTDPRDDVPEIPKVVVHRQGTQINHDPETNTVHVGAPFSTKASVEVLAESGDRSSSVPRAVYNRLWGNPSAYQLGAEFLTGIGPRYREFRSGDRMLEQLRQTPEIEAARAQIRAVLEAGPAPSGSETFGRDTGAEPKAEYVKGFLGEDLGSNPTRAFLGGYTGEWRIVDVDRAKDEAVVEFVVKNDSGAESFTHAPPPYGYTPRSDGSRRPTLVESPPNISVPVTILEGRPLGDAVPRSVLPNNPLGAGGPLGTISQRFVWTETIHFGARAARP